MTIVNIRGTSGSGKSTLVKRFLDEHHYFPVYKTLGDWKKPKIVGYLCDGVTKQFVSYTGFVKQGPSKKTFIVGRYETQCGGCDAMSYKGSHDDIEKLVRSAAKDGHNVLFEGLTISSTLTRWRNVASDYPPFWWAFMMTPEEECHQRILSRNGGREPKHDAKGDADYNRKYRGCMNHLAMLKSEQANVMELTSDDEGYATLIEVLHGEFALTQ